MCLITFAFDPDAEHPLLLAANRDEFHARPARPMAWWPGATPILAGRDEQAGGTWLAVGRDGRWAAVTNVRNPKAARGPQSRGELPLGFFEQGSEPAAYAAQVQARANRYGPFNLLVGDQASVWFASSHAPAAEIPPGVHAVSNGAFDAPWPKARRVADGLASMARGQPSGGEIFELMRDTTGVDDDDLPDTGVGLEMERFLAPPFIVSERYGTRCTTLVRLGATSQVVERRFDAWGGIEGQIDYRWSI
jgi:uncharacterized protein with NRDE domain